jgi:hypothetical protein
MMTMTMTNPVAWAPSPSRREFLRGLAAGAVFHCGTEKERNAWLTAAAREGLRLTTRKEQGTGFTLVLDAGAADGPRRRGQPARSKLPRVRVYALGAGRSDR